MLLLWIKVDWFIPIILPNLNPICYLLALGAHHILHVGRIRVNLTLSHFVAYNMENPLCLYFPYFTEESPSFENLTISQLVKNFPAFYGT